jgi:hypothetical protein
MFPEEMSLFINTVISSCEVPSKKVLLAVHGNCSSSSSLRDLVSYLILPTREEDFH